MLLLLTFPAKATWYSENIENGADIIMMDLRWPWWPSGSYFANWNTSFNPEPNNITFYAGFTSFLEDGPGSIPQPDEGRQSAFRPGNVWTFWGADAAGTPVQFVDVAPNLYIKNEYGGEGSSGTVGSEVWPFVQSKRWYTMLARVWQPGDEADQAYVGRWIKDIEAGKWHLIGIAKLPIAATSFKGNSGFLEPLTSEKAVRSLHRRFGYFRRDGVWKKSDTISIDKTNYVVVNTVAEGSHEYAAIEYAQRPDLLPCLLVGEPISGEAKHDFIVRQPDEPTLDQPGLAKVKARAMNGQLAVSWEVPDTSSPAFSFRIEVFDNPDCLGEASVIWEKRMPNLRQALLEVAVADPTVRMTATDIFDQAAPQVVVSAVAGGAPSPAGKLDKSLPGLAYELFQKDSRRQVNYFNPPLQKPDETHHWLTLDELGDGKLVRQGWARGFDTGIHEDLTGGYAIVFRGFLRVPVDGFYLLHAQIDGAYRVEIGGREVLLRDGQYGSTWQTARLSLAAGDHPLKVTYLYDDLAAKNFRLEWEGRGISREAIPLEALRIPDDDSFPLVKLAATAPGDGTGHVSVTVDGRGHEVNKTALYLGEMQLVEGPGGEVTYDGPLPAGENTLWARTIFDQNHSADSSPLSLVVSGKPVEDDWVVRNVSDANASAGLWQTAPGSFQFFGEGMHTVSQRVTGDFTATCRVDHYAGSRGEPVTPRAWVGIAALEHGDRRDWNWGEFFYLVQTARDGMRTSADFTDFGAGRMSSYPLPEGYPWLRISRQGNVWTAWSSRDGKEWRLGAYQWKKTPDTMDVGLFFSALAQNSRAHYSAKVSGLVIEPGLSGDLEFPQPVVARDTKGDRLTGVALAPSDAGVVVARSSSAGLFRSVDGGESWARANGDLRGDDLVVRSVAIHPLDPLIMLRATGLGGEGRLWKTMDGGNSWTRLAFPGDFDGAGPSSLCGEVVAFDLKNPQVYYAGCESKGFFKSEDAGQSWTNLGLEGERVTAVTVWPWEKYYPAPARGKTHLCVTTCPDAWMGLLGRGEPAVNTAARTSRGYVSHDNVRTLTVADERSDAGFYNVAFDKATQTVGEMAYATSHGLQSQVFSGRQMALHSKEKNLEWMRPFTALGTVARGEEKFGRFLTQALDPIDPGRLSLSIRWGYDWSWLATKGAVSEGGLIAVAGDRTRGDIWWFVCTDGLYSSADGGVTMAKVLDATGMPFE